MSLLKERTFHKVDFKEKIVKSSKKSRALKILAAGISVYIAGGVILFNSKMIEAYQISVNIDKKITYQNNLKSPQFIDNNLKKIQYSDAKFISDMEMYNVLSEMKINDNSELKKVYEDKSLLSFYKLNIMFSGHMSEYKKYLNYLNGIPKDSFINEQKKMRELIGLTEAEKRYNEAATFNISYSYSNVRKDDSVTFLKDYIKEKNEVSYNDFVHVKDNKDSLKRIFKSYYEMDKVMFGDVYNQSNSVQIMEDFRLKNSTSFVWANMLYSGVLPDMRDDSYIKLADSFRVNVLRDKIVGSEEERSFETIF